MVGVCKLMVHHLASKSFRLNQGRKLREDRFYAIVHEAPQNSLQNQEKSCYGHQWLTAFYYRSQDTQTTSPCKSCQEIMDAVFGTWGKERKQKDV